MGHDDLHMFLSIAEIAGVFIGFGALISAAGEQSKDARNKLVSVAFIGITVLVSAILPVWLARFGLGGAALWEWSSAGFLALIWATILIAFSDGDFRRWHLEDAKANLPRAVLFWVFLEIPIQVSLVLAILGVAPSLAPAFYVTALVLNLFEAAMMLARHILARPASAA